LKALYSLLIPALPHRAIIKPLLEAPNDVAQRAPRSVIGIPKEKLDEQRPASGFRTI
jgi:hypothetical protein